MVDHLTQAAMDFERRIDMAPPELRCELQPEFSRVLQRIRQSGQPVPKRLRKLEATLIEEVVEARFDNMPV